MNSEFDPSKYQVTITAYLEEPQTFRLSDLDAIAAAFEGSLPRAFDTDYDNVPDLLEHLSPLVVEYDDETTINGVKCWSACRPDGSLCLVPENWDDSLSGNSHSWEPLDGFGLSFYQHEFLARLGDFYWVEAVGDMETQRTFVGRFPSDEAALQALVAASSFHYFDEAGKLCCQIDEWEEEQEAEQAEAEAEADADEADGGESTDL